MLNKLVELANELDKRGYKKEADKLDALIEKHAGRHELFRALKNDDLDGAMKGLLGMNNEDLGIGTQEFKELSRSLQEAKQNETHDPDVSKSYIDYAREILGIEKPQAQTIQTHNPITGKPWTSGPAQTNNPIQLSDWEKEEVVAGIGKDINDLSDLSFNDLLNTIDNVEDLEHRARVLHGDEVIAKKYETLKNKLNQFRKTIKKIKRHDMEDDNA